MYTENICIANILVISLQKYYVAALHMARVLYGPGKSSVLVRVGN
jgi:hypothetical protein